MKPILFNTEMVKAILAGRKTQTRRPIKPQPKRGVISCPYSSTGHAGLNEFGACQCSGDEYNPRYHVGDILWVRETWAYISDWVDVDPDVGLFDGYIYKADWEDKQQPKWKSSRFMPKKAARIFLEVTAVRVERLQDITEEDAKAEGMYKISDKETNSVMIGYKGTFKFMWNNIYPQFNWSDNPFVWVYEFKRIQVDQRQT